MNKHADETLPASCVATARTEPWWCTRHQECLKIKSGKDNDFDIILLGDSIIQAWESDGAQAWQRYFNDQTCFNLGFAGDCTEHVLWRIEDGCVDGLTAPFLILLLGTNNAGHRHEDPGDIAQGINAVLQALKLRLPHTKIILMALFPRSRNPRKRMRIAIDDTNLIIQQFADKQSIFWLDINHHFLSPEGELLTTVMPDLLHPNAAQYGIWAACLKTFMLQVSGVR